MQVSEDPTASLSASDSTEGATSEAFSSVGALEADLVEEDLCAHMTQLLQDTQQGKSGQTTDRQPDTSCWEASGVSVEHFVVSVMCASFCACSQSRI